MIVSGGYLDFDLKAEEHYKLARIKVDITNDMDHEWSIDVRKAIALPPDRLRGEMKRIAKATRQIAADVYRARIRKSKKRSSVKDNHTIWKRIESHDNTKIMYRINTQNPVISAILEETKPDKEWVRKLFHALETSVPHRLIIMDSHENEDCNVDLPEDLNPPPTGLLAMCCELFRQKLAEGRSQEEAVDIVCGIEPFDSHPLYRATLDKLIEEN
jgi:hypothetical protein